LPNCTGSGSSPTSPETPNDGGSFPQPPHYLGGEKVPQSRIALAGYDEREHEQVPRATRELEKELGRAPTNEEISRRMDMPVEEVQKIETISRDPVSLETPVVRDETANILKTLSPKEEKVIRLRFGIGCEREHTLEEIGHRLKRSGNLMQKEHSACPNVRESVRSWYEKHECQRGPREAI
jgi:hypothetical protein